MKISAFLKEIIKEITKTRNEFEDKPDSIREEVQFSVQITAQGNVCDHNDIAAATMTFKI
jgi:hypothetical protein